MRPSLTSGEKSLAATAADALVAAIKAEVSHVGGTQSEFSRGLLMREQLVRRGSGCGGGAAGSKCSGSFICVKMSRSEYKTTLTHTHTHNIKLLWQCVLLPIN